MHYAISHGVLPKHLDDDLVLLRDSDVFEHGQETLNSLANSIRDPNFRIFAEGGQIHAMNRDGYRRGEDPFQIFDELEVQDPSHAFYLGYEMSKAWIALQLGKHYHQDRSLRWGFLTRKETSHFDKKSPKKRKKRGSD